jgi:hypothetical protein
MGSGAVELALLALSAATFHRDVEPLLQRHCQSCHRAGGMAPMALTTFAETRPWAKSIRARVTQRTMPPWFADRAHGKFANDPSLSDAEIGVFRDWVDAGAPRGDPADAPPPVVWRDEWSIGKPDLVVAMPKPVRVPAKGELDYQYAIIPLRLREDRWVTAAEAMPGARAAVHHIVLYVRDPGSSWLRDAPEGAVFGRTGEFTTSDILLVYAPGSPAMKLPPGMAKHVRAGSDLVLQIHYTPAGKPLEDRTRVGLVFSSEKPAKQVHTLQMGVDKIRIPPGDADYRLRASGTFPNDALLLSFFPHMHLRGRSFEYSLAGPGGRHETLLRVPQYDFAWQMDYRLAEPRLVRAGERLQVEARFDNSANNPRNPDPSAEVTWGEQSWQEMMIGFFDIAVDAGVTKEEFFRRERFATPSQREALDLPAAPRWPAARAPEPRR